MKKMSLVLNLAKLVRFQRTNQAQPGPFYDASLYVFSPKDAKKDIPEVDSPNQTVNKYLFTLKIFILTHFVLHIFYSRRECLTLGIPRKSSDPAFIGEATGETFPKNKKTIHARFFLAHALLFAEFFIFFRMRGSLGKQKATPEHKVWLAFSTRVCDLGFGV